MKNRDDIEEKFKWDLSCLCNNYEEFYERLTKIGEFLPKFKAFEGKLNNKENIWQYLKLTEMFDKDIEPLYLYAHLKSDEVLSDSKRNEMEEKLEYVLTELSQETSFASSELHELSDELLDDIIADEKFKDYDRTFDAIKKGKKHVLSKQEEKLLSGMSFLDGFSSNMEKLSDVDMTFGEIEDENHEKHQLTHSNYSVFLRSSDRVLRKNAMIQMNGEYGKYINTLANNYICDVKADCYFAKVRKHKSALDASLFAEEVTKKVYDTLIESVHNNFGVLFDYFKVKQKELGLPDFYIYDVMAQVNNKRENEKKYSYDEAIEIIKKAVSPLGEEYVSLIQRAKDERWIDVFPNVDKRSGAYQTGIYGFHPYVLTNFEGDLDSIFTLAHELGHAMHSYFSDKNQPREKAGYTIFLAEIASTTNEMLLLNYLLSNSENEDEKVELYNKLFDEIKSTLFRQTMFAEFEEKVHELVERGEPLSKDKLCDIYFDLNKQYFGHANLVPEIQYEWARIPHFFTSFYVYKYATGIICAINFVNRILCNEKDAVKDYFKFLSAGCSDTPINILRNSGCDLETNVPFDNCFNYLENMLNMWKKDKK